MATALSPVLVVILVAVLGAVGMVILLSRRS
jgi:hypothetical protein